MLSEMIFRMLVVFLLLAFEIRSSFARPIVRQANNLAKPDYTLYHGIQALSAEVNEIVSKHSDFMKVEVKNGQEQSYKASMQIVTVEFGGFTLDQANKLRVFIDCGEHGREFITSEFCLRLLHVLAGDISLDSISGNPLRTKRLERILRQTVFTILPLENEGGRRAVESGKLCERKNGRGVDTNRNWLVDWGKKEKDYDPKEEFPGTGPFSEPEVKIVKDIAVTFKPHVWLNIHSGMEAMFTAYDHKAEVPPGAQDALRILQTLKSELFTNTCVVGSGGKSVGYLAHGTATDYMYDVLHIPLSFTWEIYGDMAAHYNDCFRMFNPLTQQHIEAVTNLWLRTLFRLLELVPNHPSIPRDIVFNMRMDDAASTNSAKPTLANATAAAAAAVSANTSASKLVPATASTSAAAAIRNASSSSLQHAKSTPATGPSKPHNATTPSSSPILETAQISEVRPGVWPAWLRSPLLHLAVALVGLLALVVFLFRQQSYQRGGSS